MPFCKFGEPARPSHANINNIFVATLCARLLLSLPPSATQTLFPPLRRINSNTIFNMRQTGNRLTFMMHNARVQWRRHCTARRCAQQQRVDNVKQMPSVAHRVAQKSKTNRFIIERERQTWRKSVYERSCRQRKQTLGRCRCWWRCLYSAQCMRYYTVVPFAFDDSQANNNIRKLNKLNSRNNTQNEWKCILIKRDGALWGRRRRRNRYVRPTFFFFRVAVDIVFDIAQHANSIYAHFFSSNIWFVWSMANTSYVHRTHHIHRQEASIAHIKVHLRNNEAYIWFRVGMQFVVQGEFARAYFMHFMFINPKVAEYVGCAVCTT